MNELIKEIAELKEEKSELEKQIAELQEKMKDLDESISVKSDLLLKRMKESHVNEMSFNGLFATIFSKENIGYTSEAAVMNYLKEHGYERFIRTKVTESLDKLPLKKELKVNNTLAEALNNFTVKNSSEYVVVTTAENHHKMLEHIENNTKGVL